jgi:4-amino-4-deoxy-L-arabinose transferase-like glycosyltransferase
MISSVDKKENYPWWLPWLFTLSFILITFLPRSADDTMFMDGVTYAAIARNMSEGIGSFWRPFFAHSFWLPYDNGDYFSGHPPLQFVLQSLLFRIFGDTPAVENFYNLLILTGYICLIVKIWQKLLGSANTFRAFGWLPVLCWYSFVIVYYSIPNNFLDSTMGLFCLASCYFQLIFLKKEIAQKQNAVWPLLAGCCIVLAFLTKGPVGLYPLAFSGIYAVSMHSFQFSSVFRPTIIMLVVIAISIAGILVYAPAREFMTTYFNGQVVQALLQKREKAGTGWVAHFTLVSELLRNLLPHLIALVVFYGLSFGLKWKIPREKAIYENVLLTALVAASGIVPMLLSIKQYPHYLLPALPFVALAFTLLLVQRVALVMAWKKQLTIIALSIGTITCWGATFRKLTKIEPDIHSANAKQLRTLVPSASTIGICHDLFQHADIHANFQRYHHLSLSTQIDSMQYVLTDSACLPQFDLTRDRLVKLSGGYFLVIQNP